MKRSLILLALVAALNFFIIGAALAGNEDSVPPDTTSADRLFNPPRVITPEGSTGSDAGTPDAERTQVSKPPVGCGACSGSGRTRIGGGGGFVPGYVFANLEEINAKVKEMGITDLSERILILGGKGYARIGHLIIGGAGYGGATETSGIPDGSARHAEATIAYGGLILGLSHVDTDYEATAGMLFGGGSITVERKRNSRYVVGWNDSWDPFAADGPGSIDPEDLNIASTLVGDFIALEPFIEIKYWLLPFMALDFSASYLRATIGKGEWTVDKVRIPDSPETNIGGPSIKLGLHFGV
ncbi:MAG: hypothetical protein ABIJ00_02395 [Candidatus Eisenbacteria bacterium]